MSWKPFEVEFDDEGIETVTSRDQKEVEASIKGREKLDRKVLRNSHRDFLISLISGLPPPYIKTCHQEPWIPYWFLNAMSVLKLESVPHMSFYKEKCIDYLVKRISNDGGYSSSPQQRGHGVLSYVAINTIALAENYDSIDRKSLYNFFMSLKQPDGSFESEIGCEADSRSTYCVISVASLLNMLTPELINGVAEFILSCQNYDGGFGPIPGVESHGGYGFCSIAALDLLGRLDELNVNAAIQWCALRQMPFSGGFNGRPNKLVDTCYTWWVGSMCRILADHVGIESFWNEEALSSYVLCICQSLGNQGGVFDKPGKKPDMFHTMYSLTGLSATCRKFVKETTGFEFEEMDARYAIPKKHAIKMKEHFANQPFVC